jgi:ABC-2 type transport system permease protein
MHHLRLLATFLRVNIQQDLAYRADTLVSLAMNVMWLGWELLGLQIIFSNTPTLAGWGPGELVSLLGVWRLANTLMAALIWPNTQRFNTSIRDGSFDYFLLQPIGSQFLVSFSRVIVWRVWEVLLSIVLIVTGIIISGGSTTPLHIFNFLLLLLSGLAVIYSLWIVMIACTFWFVKFDNNVTILQALMDSGRYPATVYPAWLRLIVTFIIPIAIATTIPLQAMRGELAGWQILSFLAAGVACLLISSLVWRTGVKRYSGASS